ncbi:glycosyl hydrolase family 65 protein [Microlunatus sp. Gsoil 973]|uniref:glycosyl hydrolase family 65 protein n=1 Tax=Microlunatus sp. Gsoil 973 TaxID=2672569 RepID=UPI00351B8186
MRDGPDGFSFAPRLPPRLSRLAFGLRIGAGVLRVELDGESVTYRFDGNGVARFRSFGTEVELEAGNEATKPIPAQRSPRPAPRQPQGRSPRVPHDLIAAPRTPGVV